MCGHEVQKCCCQPIMVYHDCENGDGRASKAEMTSFNLEPPDYDTEPENNSPWCCFRCPCLYVKRDIQKALGGISLALARDDSLANYQFEPFVFRKNDEAMLERTEDETHPDLSWPDFVPVSEDADDPTDKSSQGTLAEDSCMRLVGHTCSYVKRWSDRKVHLLRKPIIDDNSSSTLADVNIVMQNHIIKQFVDPSNRLEVNSTQRLGSFERKSTYYDTGESNVFNFLKESDDEKEEQVSPTIREDNSRERGGALSWRQIGLLSAMETSDMLDSLPSLSQVLRKELAVDDLSYPHHCDLLEYVYKYDDVKRRKPRLNDRWFALLYTDNGASASPNDAYDFQYFLVRLILLSYCVAFEERDVSCADTLKEFVSRFKTTELEVRLPFVFNRGICVGSYDVMYYLHSRRMMADIFKYNTLSPELYQKFRMRMPKESNDTLVLQVSANAVPRLNSLLDRETRDTNLRSLAFKSDTYRQLELCVAIVKHSIHYWEEQIERSYWDPNLRIYVLLKTTVQKTMSMLEDLVSQIKMARSRRSSYSSSSSRSSGGSSTCSIFGRTSSSIDIPVGLEPDSSEEPTKKVRSSMSKTKGQS